MDFVGSCGGLIGISEVFHGFYWGLGWVEFLLFGFREGAVDHKRPYTLS